MDFGRDRAGPGISENAKITNSTRVVMPAVKDEHGIPALVEPVPTAMSTCGYPHLVSSVLPAFLFRPPRGRRRGSIPTSPSSPQLVAGNHLIGVGTDLNCAGMTKAATGITEVGGHNEMNLSHFSLFTGY